MEIRGINISSDTGVTFFTESNDLSSVQDTQGKGLVGLIKPILNQGRIFLTNLTRMTLILSKWWIFDREIPTIRKRVTSGWRKCWVVAFSGIESHPGL